MKIIGTGLNGLVGSRLDVLLSTNYQFTNVSRSTGVDITNKEQVEKALESSDAPFVFHLAAKANVDACEQDKEAGENGEAWQVNVIGTQNVVIACQKQKKKLLFMSTDFVFNGEKGDYKEEDSVAPVNWYAKTKAKAEEIVKNSGVEFLILRPAFPYTYFSEKKNHFVSAIYNRLKNNQPILAITDEIFTPTWIDDLAVAIDMLIQKQEKGIFHVGGASAVSPYAVAQTIAAVWQFDKRLIAPTDKATYFNGKAARPFNTSLNSGKIEQLGVKLTSFQDALQQIKMKTDASL